MQLTTMGKYGTGAVRSGPLLSSNDPQIQSEAPLTGFHAGENICCQPADAPSRGRWISTMSG